MYLLFLKLPSRGRYERNGFTDILNSIKDRQGVWVDQNRHLFHCAVREVKWI